MALIRYKLSVSFWLRATRKNRLQLFSARFEARGWLNWCRNLSLGNLWNETVKFFVFGEHSRIGLLIRRNKSLVLSSNGFLSINIRGREEEKGFMFLSENFTASQSCDQKYDSRLVRVRRLRHIWFRALCGVVNFLGFVVEIKVLVNVGKKLLNSR